MVEMGPIRRSAVPCKRGVHNNQHKPADRLTFPAGGLRMPMLCWGSFSPGVFVGARLYSGGQTS